MSSPPSPAVPHGLGQPPIFHTAADALTLSRVNALRCMRVVLYVSFRLLFGALSALDRLSSAAHERLCWYLALPPSHIYGPSESAIVIVGGDDDLGRHIALDFSEQGYTVFALCPDRSEAPPAPDAPNVSSLIQEWHQRIKRSGHPTSPWGLVAPIVLDMNSGPQRTRAFETVNAYCATHFLRLVAVVVHPSPAFVTSKPYLQPGRAGLSASAWGELVRECLVEPLSVVQDYVGLLVAASGRVILLSASGDQAWPPSLTKGVLLSAAQFLGQELRSLGIRVSTVSLGPSTPVFKSSEPMRTKASGPKICDLDGRGGHILSVRNTIDDVLRHFIVRHEDVRRTLQDIVRSRYPRERVVVGLHAMLQAAYELMPTTVHLCLQSITPYLH